MPPTLTQTQRHLLTLIVRDNGTLLLEAMINDHAMRVLLSRQGGLMGHTAPEGAPEWLTGYCTVGDRFVGPGRDTPRVTISATQIRALGNDLPADVQAEIRRCLDAHRAELHRTGRWCRCPYAEIAPTPTADPAPATTPPPPKTPSTTTAAPSCAPGPPHCCVRLSTPPPATSSTSSPPCAEAGPRILPRPPPQVTLKYTVQQHNPVSVGGHTPPPDGRL